MEAISDILKMMEGFSSGHEARRQKIGLQQTGVNNMLNAAQTEEQLNSVMSALDNIKEYSSEYDSTNFNQNAIRFAAENKKAAKNNIRRPFFGFNESEENRLRKVYENRLLRGVK